MRNPLWKPSLLSPLTHISTCVPFALLAAFHIVLLFLSFFFRSVGGAWIIDSGAGGGQKGSILIGRELFHFSAKRPPPINYSWASVICKNWYVYLQIKKNAISAMNALQPGANNWGSQPFQQPTIQYGKQTFLGDPRSFRCPQMNYLSHMASPSTSVMCHLVGRTSWILNRPASQRT